MKRPSLVLALLSLWLVIFASPGLTQKRQVTLKNLQQAAQREPQNPQVHYMLGLKYEIEGSPQKAIQAYQQAVRLKPDYPEALYRLGELKGVQGDREEAIQALAKAIKLKPDYKEAKATLGIVYGMQGAQLLEQNRWADAAQALKEAVALNPEDDAAYNNLGVAYAGQGDLAKAAEAFRAAIEANLANVEAQYNLGFISLLLGDKTGALGQYAILGNIDPGLAGELFEKISFPKGRGPYETPQWGATDLKESAFRRPSPLETIPPLPLPTPEYPGSMPDSVIK